jgi:hypothetical protein
MAMKTLDWSGVSNTPKISWYLANYGFLQASQISHWKQYHGFVLKL